jgi:hypothetical protein
LLSQAGGCEAAGAREEICGNERPWSGRENEIRGLVGAEKRMTMTEIGTASRITLSL